MSDTQASMVETNQALQTQLSQMSQEVECDGAQIIRTRSKKTSVSIDSEMQGTQATEVDSDLDLDDNDEGQLTPPPQEA